MQEYEQSHPGYRELIVRDGLRLVMPAERHAEASLKWVRQEDVVRFMGADFPDPSLEGELKRIQEILMNKDEYNWMIELDDEPIGNVSINSIDETTKKFSLKAGNFAILIGDKRHWRKGFGAALVIRRHVRQQVGGFEAMGSRALTENVASVRMLEGVGFWEIGMTQEDGYTWKNFRQDFVEI